MDYIKPVQVMLVDDDEINNFIVKTLIRKVYKNSSFITFLNTEDAMRTLLRLKANNSQLPDYILLEVNSPDMNGWSFLDEYDRLKIDNDKSGRIIVLTCSLFTPDKDRSRRYHSIGGYFIKPLTIESLNSFLK